jgi:YD repeat-containing protein
MKRILNTPAVRTRKPLARSAVLLALALAAPASARTLAPGVLFEVTYAYDSLGRPASRTVNGEQQVFEYDARDRLVAVRAEDGSDIERYRYDAVGNILEKTVRGETTRFVYDAANQLVSRSDKNGTTAFAYDAAGRLVREGNRRFVYGNDGHVSRVLEGGAVVASFDYFLDGQVAAVHARGRSERFLWDGLAMVARGDRTFLNEPAATGGNPVASMGRSFLNDMLGSTVGVHDRKARTRTAVSMTLFGETDAAEAYFTGKPELPELGYAFLVRSYRADLGKWQTRDPLGYPDGWNAMAYCNDRFGTDYDYVGGKTIRGTGGNHVDTEAEVYHWYDYDPIPWEYRVISKLSMSYVNLQNMVMVSATVTTSYQEKGVLDKDWETKTSVEAFEIMYFWIDQDNQIQTSGSIPLLEWNIEKIGLFGRIASGLVMNREYRYDPGQNGTLATYTISAGGKGAYSWGNIFSSISAGYSGVGVSFDFLHVDEQSRLMVQSLTLKVYE